MIYSFHNASFRDEDTGLYNEAYFMEVFYREWHRMLRENHALSILVVHPRLDINTPQGLKTYVKLAQLLNKCTYRSTDLVSRFNQCQFVIGLFDLSVEGAQEVIERIFEQLEQVDGVSSFEASNAFIGALHTYPTQDCDISEIFDRVTNIRQADTSRARYELLKQPETLQ